MLLQSVSNKSKTEYTVLAIWTKSSVETINTVYNKLRNTTYESHKNPPNKALQKSFTPGNRRKYQRSGNSMYKLVKNLLTDRIRQHKYLT